MTNMRISWLASAIIAIFVFAVIAVAWTTSGSTASAQDATPQPTTTPESTPQATAQQATTQQTAQFAADQAVVVTTSNGDSLNFRDDASASADVIAALPEGTYGTVVDGPVDADDTSWYQIEVDGVSGYVTSEFLADAATEGTFEADTIVYVNTDTLNLRDSADINSDVITQLSANTQATVLDGPTDANGHSWYQVDVDGETGWAARDFLALAPAEGAPVAEATTDGATLSVNTDTLNVRDAAGLDGNVLETLAFGDTVTDLGSTETVDDIDWTQIETASGTSGWAASVYLTADSADLQVDSRRGRNDQRG